MLGRRTRFYQAPGRRSTDNQSTDHLNRLVQTTRALITSTGQYRQPEHRPPANRLVQTTRAQITSTDQYRQLVHRSPQLISTDNQRTDRLNQLELTIRAQISSIRQSVHTSYQPISTLYISFYFLCFMNSENCTQLVTTGLQHCNPYCGSLCTVYKCRFCS